MLSTGHNCSDGRSQFHLPLANTPLYYSHHPTLLPGVSDQALALAAPIFAFWALSLTFHLLDTSEWKWLEKYRIHESSEVQSRNRASRRQVVWAVLLQQLIQTALGWFWMSADASFTEPTHREKMEGIAQSLTSAAMWIFGERLGRSLLESQGAALVYLLYWWGIPVSQFFFAMFFIDTWQYFLHRFMHMNKFMYKHFHSVHHRLYVPYAFGSLYNHPVEGFLLDSMGAVIAESLSGMTTRQAMLLFSISTCKTVDDHCGYRLPFDPFQLFSENYADYHDIHHQSIGAKSNFSQPFFVHWDVLLGTRMTREEANQRRNAYKKKII